MQMEFGKNRVQYDNFLWTYYNYDRYDVYFYEGGKDIANYVSSSAKKNLEDLEAKLEYQFEDKLQFIVYNKQSEFKQSNIGLITDEQYNIGGVTRIVGTKVSVYFEGDHKKLDDQIRAGVAQVLVNDMMYGGNARDMVKNSTLLNLPDWYVNGLISYLTTDWNTEIDSRVRDGVLNGKFKKFNRLTGVDATYAGHAMWHYIAETYGENVIPNILYMTRVSRNIESAFSFVIGTSLKEVSSQWVAAYDVKYQELEKNSQMLQASKEPIRKIKSARVYGQLKLSPRGNKVVYTTNEMGQFKVWMKDIDAKKAKRLYKSGQKIDRINDYSYPLLAWHPSGKLFSMIIEKKGRIFLYNYDVEDKKWSNRPLLNFTKILDFSYSDDGKKFAMSAVQKGQSDIFVFTAASNGYEQITNDIFDDLNPRFVHKSKEIVFSSNRDSDTIRFAQKDDKIKNFNKDIFLYDYSKKSNVLRRITNTYNIDESFPADYDSTYISYLSEKNGTRNRYIAYFDSTISFVDTVAHYRFVSYSKPATNYSRNILEQDVSVKSGNIADVIFLNGKNKILINRITPPSEITSVQTQNINTSNNVLKKDSVVKTFQQNTSTIETINVFTDEELKKKRNAEVNINDYSFGKENKNTEPVKIEKEVVEIKETPKDTVKYKDSNFTLSNQRNYNINFSIDYIVSQLDNTFLNSSYQKFTGGSNPIYLNPGFTGLFKMGMSDLMEDYRLVGGMRLSSDLNSNEYFVSFENRIKKIDRQLVLHRQALLDVPAFNFVKVYTHEIKYSLKLPFSEVSALKSTFNVRNDQTVTLSTDPTTLRDRDKYQTWGSVKLEYIYDNTIKRGLNLYNGVRAKVFGEHYRQLDALKTEFTAVGFDVRHYQKIYRDLIWANRIAGSTSFGTQKLIYYMGGVDNWFNPRFDQSIRVDNSQNYVFQTLATNMRGFYQNVRNGNSFALLNSELRLPLFRFLLNRPIRSDFIYNFQVAGFGDVGTAWTGYSPYSDENSLNTNTFRNGALTVVLENRREPIVYGYGFGLRSRILGYFMRFDWAWGVDDGITLPRITYFSISLDF